MAQRRGGDPHRDRVDALYREPSSNFIAARNALASALKREGEADAAERVKHLAKPSPSAWALNQVYWRERPLFGETDYPLHFGWAPLRCVRAQGSKLIQAPRPEYYDLGADPRGLHNLYYSAPPTQPKLQALLSQHQADDRNPAHGRG